MEYELYHHGILGMHWGIRRYQNKDGTWTEAGKRRYGGDSEGSNGGKSITQTSNAANKNAEKRTSDRIKTAQNAYDKAAARYKSDKNAKNSKDLQIASQDLQWAKQDARNDKIKQKLAQETKEKSKHRLKLEAHYREKGMTKEEAEVAAYKRVRTEKILAATAAVAVTAAVAYVGYKHYDKFADKILKPGTHLQHISTNSNKGVEDAFYASYKKSDMLKYRGLFGEQLRATGNSSIFKTDVKVNSKTKVASNKHARKILADLIKSDPEYAEVLKNHLNNYKEDNLTSKALEALNKGKVDDTVWEATNKWLVDHDELGSKVSTKLYQKLKDAGYDAVLDVNDMKYSGYRSKRPVIIFNGADRLSVIASKKLSDIEINDDELKAADHIIKQMTREKAAKDFATNIAPKAGSLAVGATIGVLSKRRDEDRIVQQYRKEHPNTKLSYIEILRMEQRKEVTGG